MPIYEYRCGACAHTLDALQKLSDPPLTDCPECGAVALKKLVSAPVFRLKGGGWYETDFKSDKEKKRNLADGGDGASKAATAKDGGPGDASGAKDGASGAKDGASASKADKPADKAGKSAAAKESSTGASGSKGAGTAAA